MAIKKCDDTEQVVSSEAAATTTEAAETTETQTPSQVEYPTTLGKRVLAVEEDIYYRSQDYYNDVIRPITTFGNGYIMDSRPSDIADKLRAEARKFYVRDTSDRVVYLNPDLKELGYNQTSNQNLGTSPITITSITEPEKIDYETYIAPSEASLGPAFGDKFKQSFRISSEQFIINSGDAPSPNLPDSWKVFIHGGDAGGVTTEDESGGADMTAFNETTETDAGEFGPYEFGHYLEYVGGFGHSRPDDAEVAFQVIKDIESYEYVAKNYDEGILGAIEGASDDPPNVLTILKWLKSRDEKESKRSRSEIRQELNSIPLGSPENRYYNTTGKYYSNKLYYGENSYVSRDIYGRTKYTKEFDNFYIGSIGEGITTSVRAVAYFHYVAWEEAIGDVKNNDDQEDLIKEGYVITLELFYPNIRNNAAMGVPTIEIQTFPLLSRPSPIIDEGASFTDHYTNIVAPFDQDELELYLNNLNKPAYANVKGKYNFFVPNYENYIQSEDIKEYKL